MTLSIRRIVLPTVDPIASLVFYRDGLGFEVREPDGSESMRWLAVGPPEQPDTSIVLEPPATAIGVTDAERAVVREMMSKGCYARIELMTTDLVGVFGRLEQTGAEVIQEPMERRTGVRDCVFLDPAGTVVRIVDAP